MNNLLSNDFSKLQTEYLTSPVSNRIILSVTPVDMSAKHSNTHPEYPIKLPKFEESIVRELKDLKMATLNNAQCNQVPIPPEGSTLSPTNTILKIRDSLKEIKGL